MVVVVGARFCKELFTHDGLKQKEVTEIVAWC